MEWGPDEFNKYAPIILFVYNRLEHTQRTVKSLQKNVYAEQSDLFIYSDAPKSAEAEIEVSLVRSYIKTITGFKSITIIERNVNLGLARNIIDGVTNVVNKYGKVIVLEDDMITSPFFLKYINDALNIYKDCKKVMQVAGYMYPIDHKDLPETFFLRAPDCWGWGTWHDRWKYFERNPEKLIKEFSKKDIYHFNFDGACDFWSQVQANLAGKIYTWAIFWCASVFKQRGLTLYPSQSLVFNIGCDQSGVHCTATNSFDVDLKREAITYFEKTIEESPNAFFKIRKFFMKQEKRGFIGTIKALFRVVKRLSLIK